MRINTPNLMLALGLAGAFACSDDPEPIDNNPQPTTRNIVEIASSNGDFDTLVTALQAADLVSTLEGSGPFTVFAPTNDAFAALPAGALDALLADVAALRNVLLYHVVPGKVAAADVVNLTEATTAQGEKIAIRVENGSVFINDARVVMTDIEASNGIIHVLDAVITPPEEPQSQSIVDIAVGNSDFSTLVAALQAADLVTTLEGDGPFTVFAPTNAAFDALPAGTLDALLADIPTLTEILLYHVVPGRVAAADVVTLTSATTAQGENIRIRVENGTVFIDDARVIMTDIEASNGIIHVLDAVITPPEPQPGTIAEIASANADFSTLVTALQTANLVETMNSAGPFTVFAPTDAAFAALPAGALDALLQDVPALTNVLLYHVVEGDVKAADVVNLDSATTIFGADVRVSVEADGTVKINDATVLVTDIEASNGTIHVIDAVLTPPSIVDIASSNPDFSTLVTALAAADLVDTLSGPGPFTVFAPTNAAFDALPAGTVDALLADIPALTNILLYHVVSGNVKAADVVMLNAATTLQGTDVAISVEADGTVKIGAATVVVTDIVAGNGIIHVIDTVLIPTN